MDDLECQCGKNNWDGYDENPTCSSCGTGPHQDGHVHRKTHIARKYHHGGIKPGDKYMRIVQFGYFPNGAFTLSVRKQLLEKGPAWAVDEVMDS